MPNLRYFLKHPSKIAVPLLTRFGGCLSDRQYLKLMFRTQMGYKLDLKNPKTFSEKLQWLKLYNRRPEYTTMVDKHAVKQYVANLIGEGYIIPTLGVWDKPEEIDWDTLPNKFVLKTTHGGGGTGVLICQDKESFDKDRAIKILKEGLKFDIYHNSKEWPYKNVPHRIIAEEFINPFPNVKDLPDYKWYCFDGEPKFCQVIQNRSTKETIDFFDTEWRHQEFNGLNPVFGPVFVSADTEIKCPAHLETHLQIARKLSKDLPFSRIDLYETGDHTYFGEITFYPMSGFLGGKPDQYNEILGQMIKLPGENRGGVIINELQNGDIVISQPDLPDYKFFCFNGDPKYCQVITGRNKTMCIDFFDKEWNHQPFHEPANYNFANTEPVRPNDYDKMIELAGILAKDKPFVRIDFYNIRNRIYFGEITFFPTSGLGGFKPKVWDMKFGNLIVLPNKTI